MRSTHQIGWMIVVIVTWMGAGHAAAQTAGGEAPCPSFYGPTLGYALNSSPRISATGDLNSDGYADLVLSYYLNEGFIAFLINDGSGGFGEPITTDVAGWLTDLELADIDGDGRNDLVFLRSISTGITIKFNDGNEWSGLPAELATNNPILAVTCGDLDADGDVDLIGVTDDAGTIEVLFNHGDGTFADPVIYNSAGPTREVSLADVNGDGLLDVLVLTNNQSNPAIAIMLNAGEGVLLNASVVESDETVDKIVPGDLDADGDMDLVLYWHNSPGVQFVLNEGDGTFTAGQWEGAFAYHKQIQVADLNGDGADDLVGRYSSDYFSITLARGDGTFAPTVRYASGYELESLDVADYDNDGDLDVAIAVDGSGYGPSYPDLALHVYMNNGDGTFLAISGHANQWNVEGVSIVDLNDDLLPDIVTSNRVDHFVSVALNLGDNTFDHPTHYLPFDGGARSHVVTNDMNGDGWADVVHAAQSSSPLPGSFATQLSILHNDGHGALTLDYQIVVEMDIRDLQTGDLDGDGDIDVAITSRYDTLLMFFNEGSHWDMSTCDLGEGLSAYDFLLEDLDHDGAADLVLPLYHLQVVRVMLNDGTGVFLTHTDYDTYFGTPIVQAGDLNRDGNPDVVAAGMLVVTFMNNGDGTFAYGDLIVAGETHQALAIGDIDHDGRPDICATSQASFNLSIYRNLGDGTFGHRVVYDACPTFGAVYIDDIDQDGRNDVIINGGVNRPGFDVLLNIGCDDVCLGDLDDSGAVDAGDFFNLLQHWGACEPVPASCPWDFVGNFTQPDRVVDIQDFFALLQHWGPCD
jgi:hypothetical protein